MASPHRFPFPIANALLGRLPPDEFERFAGGLQLVPLKLKQSIYKARAPIDAVYFPTSGIISAMTVMKDGSAIEVATIGKEGVVGLNAFVGEGSSPYSVIVQVPGEALRMKVGPFQQAAAAPGPLRKTLILYNSFFTTQISYAVACNGLHKIEQRCCRWLLTTLDRVGTNLLPLTHEFLGVMLGVRRASITEILTPLNKRGLVRNRRGNIEILDRAALEELSCECYRAINDEYRRLLGDEKK